MVSKAGRAKNKETRRYACDVCGTAFRSKSDLDLHNIKPKHLENVRGTKVKSAKRLYDDRLLADNVAKPRHACDVCDLACRTPQHLAKHKETAKHAKAVAEAAKQG